MLNETKTLVAGLSPVSPVQWPAVSTTVGEISVPEQRNRPVLGGEPDDADVGVDLIALPAGDRPGRLRGDHHADDKQQTGQQPTPKTDPISPHRVTPPQQ